MNEALSIYLDFHKDQRTPVVHINFTYTNEKLKSCCAEYPSSTFDFTDVNHKDLRSDDSNIYTFEDFVITYFYII